MSFSLTSGLLLTIPINGPPPTVPAIVSAPSPAFDVIENGAVPSERLVTVRSLSASMRHPRAPAGSSERTAGDDPTMASSSWISTRPVRTTS